MAIYRGTGGSGDATNDATITEVTQQATSAQNSATNAAISATNAATSATTAAQAAANLGTSETNAATSATNAATSETNAATSATNAATSATAAQAAVSSALPKAGGTMTGDLELGDSVKAKFGDSDDLQIYFDGYTSFIKDATTDGPLELWSNHMYFRNGAGTKQHIRTVDGSGVSLFYDGLGKLDTEDFGVNVWGTLKATGDIKLYDSSYGKLKIGNDDDLQIYHDGNHSIIEDVGTGAIKIKVGDFRVENASGNNLIKGVGDVASLHHAGSTKLATTSSGVDVTGTVTADGLDVDGIIAVKGNNFLESDGTNHYIKTTASGANYLYGGNNIALTANSSGNIDISGTVSAEKALIGPSGYSVYIRNISGTNRIDSYNNPITATVPLQFNASQHAFYIADAQKMAIDSSGNVLVGKSASSFTTAGVELAQGGTAGKVQIQRSSSPLSLVNLTDDGNILNFYKGTSAVGSIKSDNGVTLAIDGGTGFSGLYFGSSMITPRDNGAASDAGISLGTSTIRFKDLHLSGAAKTDTIANESTGTATTSTTQTAIATFAKADYDSAKVVISAKSGTDVYSTELLIVHNGTTASATEYGQIGTGSALATFDVDISGSNVRVLATAASSTSTVFKVTKTLL